MPDTSFITANQPEFRKLVEQSLEISRRIGATDAVAEVSESQGLAVSVRHGAVETVEQNRDRGLTITVFVGQRRGSASTSDFSAQAIEDTVRAAWHIARHTAEDPAAGLPDPEDLLFETPPDLDLYHPWSIDSDAAVEIALRTERAAFDANPAITNSEGASVSSHAGHFVLGNTRGFLAGYPYSRHTISVVPIAGQGDGMQRDAWYTTHRNPARLDAPEAVGRYAAERAVARLSARRIRTGRYPVLFEAPVACGLLGSFTQAISGGALYRRTSFLLDSLGTQVFPDHIDIHEDPHLPQELGSAPFDDEGVRTRPRMLVEDGVVRGYLLSTYTARKLGMRTTGNAGGSHNLTLTSRLSGPGDDFAGMLKKLDRGLVVTELIGQGVNYVTGDYSRGAFGYWVENGVIQHAVQEITIAGNLRDMFRGIVGVGRDVIVRGTKRTGSILINEMAVAGE